MQNMQNNMQTPKFNMQNMQNNMQTPKTICRIVHCPYSAYLTYICTPHFADADYACKRHILDILHDSNANKASFTDQGIYDRYMIGIFMSYVGIILGSGTLAGPQGLPTAFAASPLQLLRISTVLATERPATRGWGRPKFHSQALTSYTWLPLRISSPLAGQSEQLNWKSQPCQTGYLCGMMEVVLPSRKHGKSGT